MGLAPMREHRRARRGACAHRRDHNPPAGHEAGEHGGESGRAGEAAFDDEFARRFEAPKHVRGHQRRIESRERGARFWRRWRGALDDAFARGERAALIGECGQGERARGDDGGDVGFVRVGRRVAGKDRKLPPAHEARGWHRLSAHVDIGQHVGFGIEPRRSADGHDDDPGSGRDHGERLAPAIGDAARGRRSNRARRR